MGKAIRNAHRSSQGFSLVELAISVVVIGLLIAMVVGGAGLIKNAQVSSTVTQLNAVESAIQAFKKNYMSWPGDFPRATQSLLNCTAAIGCDNGDGNGAIGGANLDPASNAAVVGDNETIYAWKHLAAAGLLDGYAYASGRVAWNESHPSVDIDGGIEIYYDQNLDTNGSQGNFLRVSGLLSNAALGVGDGVDAYSVKALDVKLDDGDPLNGRITAATLGGGECVDAGAYVDMNAAFGAQDCLMFVRLKR